MASTAFPRPAMVPMMNIRPPMNGPMPRFRASFVPTPAPAIGPHGDNPGREVGSPEEVELEPVAAPVSKRSAAEAQLIQGIQSVFPRLTEEDIRGYINELRRTRQGLTGLKLVELKRQIIELILQRSGQNTALSRENSTGEECAICSETLRNGPVHKLNCDHTFHNKCIGNWLDRQRTCPICRRLQ